MPYRFYIRSKRWIKKKVKHYSNPDNGVCNLCGSTKNLHVHHKTYIDKKGNRILGKEKPHHLVTLCRSCHNSLHKKIAEENKLKKLGTLAYYKSKRLVISARV